MSEINKSEEFHILLTGEQLSMIGAMVVNTALEVSLLISSNTIAKEDAHEMLHSLAKLMESIQATIDVSDASPQKTKIEYSPDESQMLQKLGLIDENGNIQF